MIDITVLKLSKILTLTPSFAAEIAAAAVAAAVVEGYHGITVQLTYMYGALGVYFFLSFETRFLVIFRGLFFIFQVFVFVVSTGTSPTSSTTPSATFTRPHTFWMLRTYRYIAVHTTLVECFSVQQ